jgi:electron transfer flavoprotein alpha subunit
MRVAVLVKQVPALDAFALGPDGRMDRAAAPGEINPFCRRAISIGAELAAATGGTTTAITLGPPSAADTLREAIAWGVDRGLLVSDPAFAGSDSLATARALQAVIEREGPFDLILLGRNSVDADTGQVGPELAEMCGLPFLASARHLVLNDGVIEAVLEHDQGRAEVCVPVPAVVSCAERLCAPAKAPHEKWSGRFGDRITTIAATELGPGPWGAAGSPTRVGEVRAIEDRRAQRMLSGRIEDQVRDAVLLLRAYALVDRDGETRTSVPMAEADRDAAARQIVVLVPPNSERVTRELLGAAATLARPAGARVVIASGEDFSFSDKVLSAWGADARIDLAGCLLPDEYAATAARWCRGTSPWAVLVPGTLWGREVAGRLAAALGAGLTGDAVELEFNAGRLVAWKPAFGAQLVVAVTSDSPTQLVTVRAGVLPLLEPRPSQAPLHLETIPRETRSRVRQTAMTVDDELGVLQAAKTVIGVGAGVAASDLPLLEPLRALLGAELAASRKVTDQGTLPHSRQIGITGMSIRPDLYVCLGISGKFNHVVGARGASTILAVNEDPTAPIFGAADIGIVGDWRRVVPLMAEELAAASGTGHRDRDRRWLAG